MFDPRLTEEYCGLAGMPWSDQDASGEIAAMAVGASLWGLFNYTGEFGSGITKPGAIGCQYGYVNVRWYPGSEVFDKARAIGLPVKDWQDVILVNMLGKRFYDETARPLQLQHLSEHQSLRARTPISTPRTKNTTRAISSTRRWPASATAITAADRSGRSSTPTRWRARSGRRSRRMSISTPASSSRPAAIEELAGKIEMKYQRVPMPPQNLAATVARYNSFVEAGKDADFGKPKPLHKIAKPPFYAAWATPVIHDTRAGLRINARCQVVDHERRGHSRALLRRRIGGRLFHARPAPRHLPGSYRRKKFSNGKRTGVTAGLELVVCCGFGGTRLTGSPGGSFSRSDTLTKL